MDILHVHASCHNVGDMVLVRRLRDGLYRRAPDITLTSVTHRRSGAFPGADFLSLPDLLGGRVPAERLRRFRGAIIGGGDLITGRAAFRLQRTLVSAGFPVFYVGVGVNLRNVSPLLRRPLLHELNSAAAIWTRERASAKTLRDSQVGDVETGVDLSVIAFEPAGYRRRALAPTPDRPSIGVSLRSPEGNTAQWGSESYACWAELFDRWIESGRASVTFLSMTCSSPGQTGGNSDLKVLEAVRAGMRHGSEVEIMQISPAPNAWRAEFAEFDLLFGMRLHALALSTLAGIPTVALAYSPKVSNWWRPIEGAMEKGWSEIGPEHWSDLELLDRTVELALERTDEDALGVAEMMGRQQQRAEEVLDDLADRLRRLEPVRFRPLRYRVRTRAWEPARDLLERVAVRLLGRMARRFPGRD